MITYRVSFLLKMFNFLGPKAMNQPSAVKEGTKIFVSKPPITDGRGVPGGHQGAHQSRPQRISKANLQDVKLVRPGSSALQQNKEKIIKVKICFLYGIWTFIKD